MKNAMIAMFAIGCCMFLLLAVTGIVWLTTHNKEVSLRAQFNAQQQANESIFDRTWKIIKDEAQIPEKYGDDFRKTYVEIMKARNPEGQGGTLARFLTEANVQYSPELYSKLMTTIEAQRTDFDRCQQKLIDISGQHASLLGSGAGVLFLSGRQQLEAVIVTSEATEKAFSTGKSEIEPLFGASK